MAEDDTALSPSAQAELYNNLSNLQFKDGSLLIEELLKPQTGEAILDLGCGTGRATMVLASRVGPSGRVVGVDPNKSRVEVAQKTLAESEVKHVSFKHGSCANAISDGPFDAIFSNYVLHWIKDHAPIFQDAYKCLRSGGRFVFLTAADCPPMFRVMMKGLVGSEEMETVLGHKYGKVDYWTKVCTEAGFTIESMEEKAVPHSFPDALSVLHFSKATVPSDVVMLPNPKKADVVEWMKPFTDESTGRLSFHQPVVRAVVKKP
jgi:trans-aconitate methyltransferase